MDINCFLLNFDKDMTSFKSANFLDNQRKLSAMCQFHVNKNKCDD